MTNNQLYNGSNLDFTGSENPYGLIQKGGKKKRTRKVKSKRKCGKRYKCKKTRKYRR